MMAMDIKWKMSEKWQQNPKTWGIHRYRYNYWNRYFIEDLRKVFCFSILIVLNCFWKRRGEINQPKCTERTRFILPPEITTKEKQTEYIEWWFAKHWTSSTKDNDSWGTGDKTFEIYLLLPPFPAWREYQEMAQWKRTLANPSKLSVFKRWCWESKESQAATIFKAEC